MNLQAGITRFVVESVPISDANTDSLSGNVPKVKVVHAELAVLDLDIAVHHGDLGSLAFDLTPSQWTCQVFRLFVRGFRVRFRRLSSFLAQEFGCFEAGVGRLIGIACVFGLVPASASSVSTV